MSVQIPRHRKLNRLDMEREKLNHVFSNNILVNRYNFNELKIPIDLYMGRKLSVFITCESIVLSGVLIY